VTDNKDFEEIISEEKLKPYGLILLNKNHQPQQKNSIIEESS